MLATAVRAQAQPNSILRPCGGTGPGAMPKLASHSSSLGLVFMKACPWPGDWILEDEDVTFREAVLQVLQTHGLPALRRNATVHDVMLDASNLRHASSKDILDLWEGSSGVDRATHATLLIVSDACYSGEWALGNAIWFGGTWMFGGSFGSTGSMSTCAGAL